MRQEWNNNKTMEISKREKHICCVPQVKKTVWRLWVPMYPAWFKESMKNHDCFSKYINQTIVPMVSQDMLMTTARFAISFVPLVVNVGVGTVEKRATLVTPLQRSKICFTKHHFWVSRLICKGHTCDVLSTTLPEYIHRISPHESTCRTFSLSSRWSNSVFSVF